MTEVIQEPVVRRLVQPEEGQRWTFVHSSGKRTEYVVQDIKPYAGHEEMAVFLLNEQTGRTANVTTYWLWRKPERGVSHWLPPEGS